MANSLIFSQVFELSTTIYLYKCKNSTVIIMKCDAVGIRCQDDIISSSFLSSPLAGKQDIVVTILVRCMCVR